MSLKQRVAKLEKQAGASRRRTSVKLCYIGDGRGAERELRIVNKHSEKYGSTDNLVILKTMVPDPSPLPPHLREPESNKSS
jgi:hypothetical protein